MQLTNKTCNKCGVRLMVYGVGIDDKLSTSLPQP